MKVTEDIIRDHLAERLELIEDGLSLLRTEAYLPSKDGANGFVDILAKDAIGRFVLIELKRTDAAAREAIHEVLKYVESTKAHFAVDEADIRVFIVSVEWHELLVPFSAFVAESPFSLTGIRLEVNSDGIPASAVAVEPLRITGGRLFTPWHELRFYDSDVRMAEAMNDFRLSCKEKGIDDYTVIEMTAAEHHQSAELSRRLAALSDIHARYGNGEQENEFPLRIEPTTVGLLYFAMLQISDEKCLAAVKALGKKEDVEEFLEVLEDQSGEARTGLLHEKILDVGMRIRHDGYEIGYPAKFSSFYRSDEWEVTSVHRFGALSRNTLLTDETILSELRGEQGVTRQGYERALRNPDAKALARVRQDVADVLRDNPQWAQQAKQVLEEISKKAGIKKLQISLMNPCNTLLHLFLFIHREDANYLPSLSIQVEREEDRTLYFGGLVPNGVNPSLKKILKDHYQDSAATALMSLSWGGYEENNAKVTRDAGLAYALFELDELAVEGEEEGTIRRLSDLGFEPSSRRELSGLFRDYFPQNAGFIQDFGRLFAESWNGVFVDYSIAESFDPLT